MICDSFKKLDVIKDFDECSPEYIEKLREYLAAFAGEFFGNKSNEACAWNDFDYFNKTTDREHLVMPEEVCLIDRDWEGRHCYVICRLGREKKSRCKDLAKVIEIDAIKYGDWKNGYFLLPGLSRL